MIIDDSGNVGIGKVSPDNNVHSHGVHTHNVHRSAHYSNEHKPYSYLFDTIRKLGFIDYVDMHYWEERLNFTGRGSIVFTRYSTSGISFTTTASKCTINTSK